MIKKFTLIFIVTLLFLVGCTEPIGGDAFFEKVNMLEEALRKEEWSQVDSNFKDLKKLHKENNWKLQLLGDEGEYEGMNESIFRLASTIKSKDSKQSLLELATIKAYLDEIYSM